MWVLAPGREKSFYQEKYSLSDLATLSEPSSGLDTELLEAFCLGMILSPLSG